MLLRWLYRWWLWCIPRSTDYSDEHTCSLVAVMPNSSPRSNQSDLSSQVCFLTILKCLSTLRWSWPDESDPWPLLWASTWHGNIFPVNHTGPECFSEGGPRGGGRASWEPALQHCMCSSPWQRYSDHSLFPADKVVKFINKEHLLLLTIPTFSVLCVMSSSTPRSYHCVLRSHKAALTTRKCLSTLRQSVRRCGNTVVMTEEVCMQWV